MSPRIDLSSLYLDSGSPQDFAIGNRGHLNGPSAYIQDVEAIVACAVQHGVCLIPFGGGTSVTLGLAVPEDERRMVATVSLSFMQKILAFDRDALLLSVEAGAVGAVLEEQLRRIGVTLGHEPDSLEFSTVGGWVATRASGEPSGGGRCIHRSTIRLAITMMVQFFRYVLDQAVGVLRNVTVTEYL